MSEERGDASIGARLEKGLGSRGRLRLLGILARHPSEFYTRYALEKLSGVRSTWLRADLAVLMELGWIREFATQPRKYQLNQQSANVVHIVEFFRKVGYL